MDRVDLVLLGQRDDVVDVQVRLQRLARLADRIRFVRLEAVEGVAILVRVHRDRANAQLVGAAKHADGDLAAIGGEQSANWLHGKSESGWRGHAILAGSDEVSEAARGKAGARIAD